MNNKIVLICIAVFLGVTIFALSLDNKNGGQQIRISSRNIALNNDSANVLGGKDVNVQLNGANISNAQIDTKNQGVNVGSSSGVLTSDINFNDSNINYNAQGNQINTNNNIKYENIDTSNLDAALKEANNINNQRMNTQSAKERRYMYKNIDWSTWKSNFVNQILEDSFQIRELDNYKEGDWLSYSFTVDKNGRIRDISVVSLVVKEADRAALAKLIKSYEKTDITVFPENSKKNIAKVEAVMVLSNVTQKTTPRDFNEHEKIRVEY